MQLNRLIFIRHNVTCRKCNAHAPQLCILDGKSRDTSRDTAV